MTNRIPWGPDSPGYPQCPTPAGHDVTVWFRDGRKARDDVPEGWSWKDTDSSVDIIAYCDHDAQDEARELLDHEAAIASITDCAATTTILSYREAIEGYLRLRGLDAYLERKQ